MDVNLFWVESNDPFTWVTCQKSCVTDIISIMIHN